MPGPNGKFHRAVLPALILLLAASTLAQTGSIPNRNDIDPKYTWDLTHVYPDWTAWEIELAQLDTLATRFAALKGTLSDGPENIHRAFKMSDDLSELAYRVYKFPGLTLALNNADNEVAARLQRVQILFSKFIVALSWFTPEMLSLPRDTMQQWLNEYPNLEPYRFSIEDAYRQQSHVLDEDKERLLSYFAPTSAIPYTVYKNLTVSDMVYNSVMLSDGETVTITEGNYDRIASTNRGQQDRAAAFEALYKAYHVNRNTYAAIYDGVVQTNWAHAQARDYGSCLEASLDANAIPVEVVETLINTVRNGLEPLHRYHKVRKKALGLSEYHSYDASIPVVDVELTVEYDKATQWVCESVAPLGKDYQQIVRQAIDNRWVDVYETKGKSTGGYCDEVYGIHPYILLNYNNTLTAAMVLAHEMGHAMHTYLAQKHQPISTCQYSLFVAEVASAINEALFFDYLLEHMKDPYERVAILVRIIDDLVYTFYNRTMYADYELQVHRLAEQGQPITADILTALYSDLWKEQAGEAMVYDTLYGSNWCRIPHLYVSPFYVFQYSTSHAAAENILRDIRSSDKKTRERAIGRYLELLKSGGNDHPMNQLLKAGVDMSDPATYTYVVEDMDRLVTRLEEELAKL
ncbi:MAG: oligoendopeptidase F [Candidatus Zixiibacteriota bacterium]|nr:MAG: oligoendopeptidase F [candidate division Zixibacteria bacterium]